MRGRPRKVQIQPTEDEVINRIEGEQLPEGEAPWWTTMEVAKALGRSQDVIRAASKKLDLFAEAKKGTRQKYSLTDVMMIRRELERQKREKASRKRNHTAMILELKRMIDAKDRGEF